jgi:hypothetical protein
LKTGATTAPVRYAKRGVRRPCSAGGERNAARQRVSQSRESHGEIVSQILFDLKIMNPLEKQFQTNNTMTRMNYEKMKNDQSYPYLDSLKELLLANQ